MKSAICLTLALMSFAITVKAQEEENIHLRRCHNKQVQAKKAFS
ncbi:MAG: hypothetical protein AABN95_22610 [Acidobacteriota bacterium]